MLNLRINEYVKEGILKKQDVSDDEVRGHIKKAEHNLSFIKDTIKQGYSDWAVVGCYYAAYHVAVSLAIKAGYSSKNHDATLCILIKYYHHNGLETEQIGLLNKIYLDNEDVLFYIQSKQEREKASYSTALLFNKKQVQDLHLKTVMFVNHCKEIMSTS